MMARYSFLLISNKFCDLSLLHWMGAHCNKKNLPHWALSFPPNPSYGPLTHVNKTTYGPLIDTALYVIILMRANPLLGQVEGGCALEISTFLGHRNRRSKKATIDQRSPTSPATYRYIFFIYS
jgi:hypothetical protein